VQRRLYGEEDDVTGAMEAVNRLSEAAGNWLKQRLQSAPDKLSQHGRYKDSEVVPLLTDLMGAEQSVELVNNLLAMQTMSAQLASIKVIHQLKGRHTVFDETFRASPAQFLESLQAKFSGEGEDLVKQLVAAKVLQHLALPHSCKMTPLAGRHASANRGHLRRAA
jgi:hypothetical protein